MCVAWPGCCARPCPGRVQGQSVLALELASRAVKHYGWQACCYFQAHVPSPAWLSLCPCYGVHSCLFIVRTLGHGLASSPNIWKALQGCTIPKSCLP